MRACACRMRMLDGMVLSAVLHTIITIVSGSAPELWHLNRQCSTDRTKRPRTAPLTDMTLYRFSREQPCSKQQHHMTKTALCRVGVGYL